MNTGKRIRDFRVSNGYSYTDFCKEVGIHPRTLSRVEKSGDVKQKYIDKIESRFGISLADYKVDLFDKSVGEIVSYYRIKRGLTRDELTAALGINKSYLSAIETGGRIPSASLLLMISKTLKINIKLLMPDVPDNEASIGEKVRYYRRLKGLKQKELAELVGVEPSTISRIERNIVNLSDDLRKRMAETLCIKETSLK